MLTKEEKTAIMQKYATKEGDTGSPESTNRSINC